MVRENTSSKCKNMHSKIVYVLYSTVLCSVCVGSLGVAGSDAALPVSGQPSGSNVHTAVAKMIDAILADGQQHDGTIPIPEHHHDKAQRIVPRKGVDNEGSSGSAASVRLMKNTNTGLNVGSSTSHSAPVVASDDKPTVVSTVTPGAGAGIPAEMRSATSGGVESNSSTAGISPSQLPLSNATAVANKTTVANASSTAASSSTSAIATASSTPAPPQSKPAVVGGPTATSRASTNSTSSTAATSTSSSSTTTTTTTSTTTTTTTTTAATTPTTNTTSTTTTTTKPPKKPKVTFSVEDEPKLLQAAKAGYASPYDTVDSSGRLRVDEPLAQLSKEYIPQSQLVGRDVANSRREYVVPIVTLIFAIPLLLGLFLLSYRRAKEFWLTRHYRRMDFLIDGMYNY